MLSIMWRTPRSTARSSASAKITLAPLPPSSSVTRFSVSAAALEMARPARVDPVKEIISTSGWLDRRLPTPMPSPFTRLNTPGGRPASWQNSAKIIAFSGLSSEGFSTQVQPAKIAGIAFSAIWFIGQFHGVIRPTTPIGSRMIRSFGAWSPSGRSHSSVSNAVRKLPACHGRHGACNSRACFKGEPISRLMAWANSSLRASYCSKIRTTAARRVAGEVAAQAGNAALAAATAASQSASDPSEITATGSSLDGLITLQSRPAIGATQRPLM